MSEFEPRIVGFVCNWCAYAAADLAGSGRLHYAPNISLVRVMCSGRVDPTFVLQAFAAGADGVLVAGCHPGDCHYLEGNRSALRRMKLLQRVLHASGIDPRRVRLEWISAAEHKRFAEVASSMTEEIRALGRAHLIRAAPAGRVARQ